jgi:hypothetical protein
MVRIVPKLAWASFLAAFDKRKDGRVATEGAWLNRNNLEKAEMKKKEEKERKIKEMV